MPFKSEAQHRKFRVLLQQGKISQSEFDKWMGETKKIHGKKNPIKALPDRVKQAFVKSANDYPTHVVNLPSGLASTDDINENNVKISENHDSKDNKTRRPSRFCNGFRKSAGGPGSGVSHPNTDTIDFLETSPIISIGYRKKFMETHKPVSTSVKIPTNKIKYKGQEKMVPKKLIKMIKIWDEVKDKPIDVIVDSEGAFHILDGHHRALAAILTKNPTVLANVYKAPMELE